MQITREVVQRLRDELRRVVQDYMTSSSDLNDLQVTFGNAKFCDHNVTFKVEIAARDALGQVIKQEVSDFTSYAAHFGLSPNDLGREFTEPLGDRYKITGIRMKNRRYPIICENVATGQTFRFTAVDVKYYLASSSQKP